MFATARLAIPARFPAVDMESVADVAQYIASVSDVITSQQGLLPSDIQEGTINSMASAVIKHIREVKRMDGPGATALNSAISASAFPAAVKTRFATAVVERLTAPAAEVAAASDGVKQVMVAPCNFVTESDWTYIKDKSKSRQQVAVRVRERMSLVGLVNISEKTFGCLASMIAAAREPDMSAVALKALVDELKQAVIAYEQPPAVIQTFPTSPQDLPRVLFDRAYSQEGPCPQNFPNYNTIVKRCPVRSSHRQLRTSPPARGRSVGTGASSSASIDPMYRALVPLFEGAMTNFANQMIGSNRRIVFGDQSQQPSGADEARAVEIFDDGAANVQPQPRRPIVPKGPQLDSEVPADTTLAIADQPPHGAGKPGGAGLQLAVPGATACGGASDKRSAQDIVSELERIATGVVGVDADLEDSDSDGQSPGGPLKRPSAAGGPLKRPSAAVTVAKSKATPAARKASPMPVIKKRPATKTKGIKLGCGRCRGSQLGCLSCRDPEFTGKRWQK